MSSRGRTAIAVTAALIAVPVYGQSAGFQQQPAVVHIQQQPAIVQVPSASDTRARASTPIVYERIDENARARAHAKYEAEKRRGGTASGVAAAGSTRMNEHPMTPVSRPSVAESRPSVAESRPSAPARAAIIMQAQTPEEAKSAEEARAAFLERAPGLSVHERTFAGAGERSAAGESIRPGASDAERARDILSELR